MFAQRALWTSRPTLIQAPRMFRHLTIRRDVAVTTIATGLLLSATLSAHGQAQQTEDPNVVAAARALAIEGVKLAQNGKCEDAIDKLERAEQLRHSAIVLEQLGECYVEKGRLVEGAEALRAVIREGQPENASETLKKANANAHTLLDATKDKIAMLTISIEVVGKAQPTVEIDGQVMPPALIGAARPTDPGEHTIEATANGHLPARRRIALTPGQSDSVALTLVVDPNAAAKAPPSPAVANTERAPEPPAAGEAPAPAESVAKVSGNGPDHVPAYIAWGVAGAALAVGVAYGWVAMDQKSDLDKACPQHRCPPTQTERLDAAKANGVISSVAFGVGVGAAVAGGLLFFLAADSSSESQPSAARLQLGPGAAGVELKF
jgi:hypothetical protein